MPVIKHRLLDFFILVSLFITTVFIHPFNEALGFYDEAFAAFFLGIIAVMILSQKKIHLYKEEIYVFYLLVFLTFLGFLSNYMTQPDNPTDIRAIISDFIVIIKCYLVYFGIRLFNVFIDSEWILKTVANLSIILFFVLLIFVIYDLAFVVYPRERRYGLKSIELFFGHPSRYSFVFSFIFLSLFSKYINRKTWFLFIILAVGLLSLRVKYFGFVTLAFLIFYFKDYIKRIPRQQFFIYAGLLFLLFFILFKERILMFFSIENLKMSWSRGILLVKSIDIGNDFFPWGTGFGTYASFFSGEYYSWVYAKYGIDKVWGITADNPAFIADQFWPMVLGQFGYFGLLAYMLIMVAFIFLFLKLLRYNSQHKPYAMVVALLALFLLIIDSTSDAIFTQDRAVSLFTLMGLLVNTLATRKTETIDD